MPWPCAPRARRIAPRCAHGRRPMPWSGRLPYPAHAEHAPEAAPAPWCGAGLRLSAALWPVRASLSTLDPWSSGIPGPRRSVRLSAVAAGTGCYGEPVGDQPGEPRCNLLHVPAPIRLAPVDDGIAHAEHREHGKSRVGVALDAALGDAGQDHVLEAALDPPGLAAHAPTAPCRQIAALVDEYLDVVVPRLDGGEVSGYQSSELFERCTFISGDSLRGLDEAVGAAQAHELERCLLGGEVVVEAGLAHAEHIRDRLRGRAVIAPLREHTCRRVDDLVLPPQHSAIADQARAGDMSGHCRAPVGCQSGVSPMAPKRPCGPRPSSPIEPPPTTGLLLYTIIESIRL